LFRPTFHNRVNKISFSNRLPKEHLKQTGKTHPVRLRARLADRHITLELSDAARGNLVRTGYDPHYGARPLKRAIQKKIETPLGRLLLGGKVRDGQTVLVDANRETGDLSFTPEGLTVGVH